MSVFEFLLALYSIVAGLGMSLVVRSIGQLIEARGRVRHYWVHSCLVTVAFVAQVVSWFSLWQFSDHAPWTVADTLLMLIIPLLLYLVGHLVVPEVKEEQSYDLRDYYYRHARWTHGLLIAVVVVSLIGETVILGRFERSGPQLLRIVVGIVLLPGAITTHPGVHATQAVLLLLLMAVGLAFVSVPIG